MRAVVGFRGRVGFERHLQPKRRNDETKGALAAAERRMFESMRTG